MLRVGLLALAVATGANAQGRFVPAGQLATARTAHSATRLKDGRVLVVGGRSVDGLTVLSSVELYEPRTHTWRVAAPLLTARANHTATLLSDGRVLVAGGTALAGEGDAARFTALANAELYEPGANRWTAAGAMLDARNGHSATLLNDGSVLIVGGTREARTFLSSVERFDPRTATFEKLPRLSRARSQHAAVRLEDGSVVVVGGRDAHGSLDSVERFDATTWTLAPVMSEPRQRTTAVALGALGVVVIGGQTRGSSTNLAETWAPGGDAWHPFENHLSMALSGHTATALPTGDMLVIGGEPPNEVDTNRAQRWRATTRTWCLAGQLRTSRRAHTATALADGKVLVVGGTSGGVPERTVELWEDAKGACEEP